MTSSKRRRAVDSSNLVPTGAHFTLLRARAHNDRLSRGPPELSLSLGRNPDGSGRTTESRSECSRA